MIFCTIVNLYFVIPVWWLLDKLNAMTAASFWSVSISICNHDWLNMLNNIGSFKGIHYFLIYLKIAIRLLYYRNQFLEYVGYTLLRKDVWEDACEESDELTNRPSSKAQYSWHCDTLWVSSEDLNQYPLLSVQGIEAVIELKNVLLSYNQFI